MVPTAHSAPATADANAPKATGHHSLHPKDVPPLQLSFCSGNCCKGQAHNGGSRGLPLLSDLNVKAERLAAGEPATKISKELEDTVCCSCCILGWPFAAQGRVTLQEQPSSHLLGDQLSEVNSVSAITRLAGSVALCSRSTEDFLLNRGRCTALLCQLYFHLNSFSY